MEVFLHRVTLFLFMIFEISGLYDIHICLKTGLNLNRMENWAVKRNFYHIYQNSNMHKKVDMLNPVNSDWG